MTECVMTNKQTEGSEFWTEEAAKLKLQEVKWFVVKLV